jgi:hypothetical protein
LVLFVSSGYYDYVRWSSFYNLFLSFPFFNGEGEIGGREENASGRINDTGWMSESG